MPCPSVGPVAPPVPPVPPASSQDGFALPFGIAWSLVLVGIFFAKPLNDMKLLTLPDVFGRKFGPAAEASFAFFAIVSFICLFGSNLARRLSPQPQPRRS